MINDDLSTVTRRYALDKNNHKAYIGSAVKYNNEIYIVEEIDYLSWTTKQYLTLLDKKNKNKKVKFVSSSDVIVYYSGRKQTRNNKNS